jgi:hypothetical protein
VHRPRARQPVAAVAAAAAAASERLSNKRPPGAGKHGAQDGAAQQKENHARARV